MIPSPENPALVLEPDYPGDPVMILLDIEVWREAWQHPHHRGLPWPPIGRHTAEPEERS